LISQQRITPNTPMGATLTAGGATFRVWAPRGTAVHLCGQFNGLAQWNPVSANLMLADGFVPGAKDGKLNVSAAYALSGAKQTRPDQPLANKNRRLKAVQQDFNHNDPGNPSPGRLRRPEHRDRKCRSWFGLDDSRPSRPAVRLLSCSIGNGTRTVVCLF
jgi:Carbohydrate-binding module 48 (Isoamylase N-terminal domain)